MSDNDKRVLHCWESNTEWAEAAHGLGSAEYEAAWRQPGTCMLEAGHNGPHVFTPDDDIVVRFTSKETP